MRAPLVFSLSVLACALSLRAETAVPIDSRGPLKVQGMTVRVSPGEVEAPNYTFSLPPELKEWSAHWIVSAAASPAESPIALLRKEVTLDEAPTQVRAWMTSGNYRLYINGRLASRGPADFGRDISGDRPSHFWFYDYRDLTPFFHAGKNVIAVETSPSPGFLFRAEFTGAKGKTILASDESWRGTTSGYLSITQPSAEDGAFKDKCQTFDGTQEPIGWQAAGFDDAAWPACKIAGAPNDPLTLSEIPPHMEALYPMQKIDTVEGAVQVPEQPLTPGHPVLVTGNGSFLVHFDRVLPGRCGLAVKGGAGARLYIAAAENEEYQSQNTLMVLRDGVQYFEAPDYASIGRIKITARNVTTPIEIREVNADYASQPVRYAGSFTCSDPLLNEIWKDCRWAVQICLQTWHVDSPHAKEPISDYGDYLIEDLCGYAAFENEQWLARQDLRKWAAVMRGAHYGTFHTSYTLLWLQSLINYYDATGDLALVKELAPTVDGLLDQFATYVGKNGLISEAPNYMFMDWVEIAGFPGHHPPAVIGQGYLTAFYYRALADGRRVAELAGNPERAARYAALRPKIAEAYERELWNPDKGLYRDGKPFQTTVKPNDWLPADKEIETFTAQNNVLAVLYDLAPADRQADIIRRVMAVKPWNVRPYYMHFVLGAIAHAGLFDTYGPAALRGWKVNPETQTFREMGDAGDYSHGWIATPLYQMSAHFLGIAPAGPGYETISIRPLPGDLQFAKGAVPTPHGVVKVDWKRDGDRLTIHVTVPKDTHARFAFPTAKSGLFSPTVALNGSSLWPKSKPREGVSELRQTDQAVEMTLAPGDYQFAGTGPGAAP
jgi:alpha-L-rhamnosidase